MTVALRFFLFIFVVLNLALAGVLIAGFFQWQPAVQVIETYWTQASYMSPEWWIGLAAVAVWALISLLFLLPAFKPKKKPKEKFVSSSLSSGRVDIPFHTIENIAYRSAITRQGVTDVRVTCTKKQDNQVALHLKVTPNERTPVQSLSSDIQETVKQDVERIAEVDVSSVDVSLSKRAAGEQGRQARVQ
ncbi:hypothetical protein ATL39_1534 [Sinobaca qinghaiensis]|uniref:Alkaline shock family protein YloU n=1 Tax=Sinobaca qinghaiensis TaxID=342944 RepID=A0A419V422_9BACL|nr:alkaline shock response membrane anchor protein AmaP [Sinobaca qinghaiensis]RKD73243.1 hypothetical protein ATL39_1534 [Sinobaca qinghaiensis]